MGATTSRNDANATKRDSCSLFCGWGRVLFAQTFDDPEALAREMTEERRGERDIAAYVSDPHVALSYAPQRLFLDPSDMLRLDLGDLADAPLSEGIEIRRVVDPAEARAINELYLKRDMVPSDSDFIWRERESDEIVLLVAVDTASRQVVGTVTGLDHVAIFDDPEQGSSLWCLAVSPTAALPGIGESLVRALATHFRELGRARMDLSVIHDNHQAKALYAKLGFRPVQVFSLKAKNAHNEALFLGPELEEKLNPYARIIVDEARSRGISAEVLDEEEGYFRLSRGGKSVVCRESLSELTTAIAMSRCQDKYVTHRWLDKAGLRTPAFRLAGLAADDVAFLERHRKIVVKPAIGEQGNGITVGVETEAAMSRAIGLARRYSERVVLESFHEGEDLRIVVIAFEVVAAAVRRPAHVVGDGNLTAETLIAKQSRRRQAATGGESRIPVDDETLRCLEKAGYDLDSVIPKGEQVTLQRTANLHTGGTIHDVTRELHPALAEVAEQAARRLDIPVVGLDLIVRGPDQSGYVILEANERPGLANHEPQPTAQRFVDMLFPLSIPALEASLP
ncbi:MAG: N-acetylglutaminylglutamine synthetase [Myxococcales bacterium]|nr:N-acetylglutaminylglutamine synthetase [Myxococcales bacterium]